MLGILYTCVTEHCAISVKQLGNKNLSKQFSNFGPYYIEIYFH